MTLESFSVATLFALAMLPMVVGVSRCFSVLAKAAAWVGWGVLSIVVGWASGPWQAPTSAGYESASHAEPTDRPLEVAGGDYVSSKTCKTCHPHYYRTWHQSYHRTMTQVASDESVVAPFDDQHFEFDGQHFRLFRRGDEFWMQADRADRFARGETPRFEHQIVLTTGSHNMQSYWMATGEARNLGLVPLAYLIHEKRWIPSNSGFLQPPHPQRSIDSGQWNKTCVRCHTTGAEPRIENDLELGTLRARTQVAEFGISCEACHGPGSEHIRTNRNPIHRYRLHLTGEADETIVNPRRLPADRSSQVCGQCHGITVVRGYARHLRWMQKGYSYRPGDDLHESRIVVGEPGGYDTLTMQRLMAGDPTYQRDRFWPDGVVRISGREYNGLINSPCFVRGEGDRKLSCLSCHSMHPASGGQQSPDEWADDQLAVGMRGNRACADCHRSYVESPQSHTHHKIGSSGNLCYNCHMSHTTFGLQKAIRSHTIESPSVAVSQQTGRPLACNQCHLDQTLAWSAGHLSEWYDQPMPELSDDEQSIAASLLGLLRGDAGERALMAWSMGWQPARDVSGTRWMGPLLIDSLDDPYEVVRLIAYRSLRTLPGMDQLKFNFVATKAQRNESRQDAKQLWAEENDANRPIEARVLFDPKGKLRWDVIERLLQQRDHRLINLKE